MDSARDLGATVSMARACAALGLPRATYYRRSRPRPSSTPARRVPPRSLQPVERQQVLEVLHSERFVDAAPREVFATLLDEGNYLCSPRTMYRILAENGEVRERRDQVRRPGFVKPELLATAPNQVWSWDITKLRGPAKWTYFYLYVILDIFSRLVVGWMIAYRETAELAKKLIEESARKHGIQPDQLTVHADRGSSMTSKPVAFLFADLGITKSHSRPHVSDDNPFSEAQFKTLKYRPGYPESFGSIEDARAWAGPTFQWYNHQHHHTGLGLLTPAAVHFGDHPQILQARRTVLAAAYAQHPDRFVHGPPTIPDLPAEVWINPPAPPTSEPTRYGAPGREMMGRVDPGHHPLSGSDVLHDPTPTRSKQVTNTCPAAAH
jgi:putative transposase